MTFTENSGLVKLWARLIENGTYTRDQIPSLYNLQEIVCKLLDVTSDKADA